MFATWIVYFNFYFQIRNKVIKESYGKDFNIHLIIMSKCQPFKLIALINLAYWITSILETTIYFRCVYNWVGLGQWIG